MLQKKASFGLVEYAGTYIRIYGNGMMPIGVVPWGRPRTQICISFFCCLVEHLKHRWLCPIIRIHESDIFPLCLLNTFVASLSRSAVLRHSDNAPLVLQTMCCDIVADYLYTVIRSPIVHKQHFYFAERLPAQGIHTTGKVSRYVVHGGYDGYFLHNSYYRWYIVTSRVG